MLSHVEKCAPVLTGETRFFSFPPSPHDTFGSTCVFTNQKSGRSARARFAISFASPVRGGFIPKYKFASQPYDSARPQSGSIASSIRSASNSRIASSQRATFRANWLW